MTTPTQQPVSAAYAALLDALQKHVVDRAVPALDSALAGVDDYLFDRSQNSQEMQAMMTLREIRRARGQVVQAFRQTILGRFRELRERQALGGGEGAGLNLSLLSDQALEAQLAVEQLAASVLRHHASAYEVASKRLGVVVGLTELQPRENPIAPVFLADALSQAIAQMELDDDVRIVMFKFFERELGKVLGDIYERCNTLMATGGVLPELQASTPTARMSQPRASGTAQGMPGGESSAAPIMPPHMPQMAMHGMQPPQFTAPMSDAAYAPTASPADQMMLANMLGMLQNWRSAVGMPVHEAQTASAPVLPTQDLLSVLSLMQHDATPAFRLGDDNDQSLASQLRLQLAQSAKKLGVAHQGVKLDALDSDAVDLVALLFDVLLDGPQYDNQIRQKIGRMLIPYVKVALKDRRMFLYKEHPARRLLNTVAEACEGNRGEEPQEKELLTQVDQTIDRLVVEFNEDVAIFETLEQELRAYMAQHRKRFELAERRTAEAQRGRERLEDARQTVAEDLQARRADRQLPLVLDSFLSKHTTHHLVQIVLRDGKASPRYRDGLHTVDDLLTVFDLAASDISPELLPKLPEAGLLEILASAGCNDEVAEEALAAIRDALARAAAGVAPVEDDIAIPAQADMPELAPLPLEPLAPLLEVVADNASLDFDAAMLERIRTLKVGDWVQLAGTDGHFAPAKVSWISPISSRLLLVNKRGIRVLVASVQELAVMAKLDKVIVREADNAFDNAMQQMADRLQTVTQQAAPSA